MATGVLPLIIGIGGMLVSALFAPKKKTQYGQRTPDTNIPTVNPGNTIPRVWGMMKLPTQLIWTSKLIETAHVEKVGGGKGGLGGGSQKQVTYTYSVDCAQGVCQGPILKILRIRANSKPIWLHPDVAPAVAGGTYDLIKGKYFQRAAVAGYSSTVINQDIYFDAAFEAEFERLHEEEGLATTDSMVSAYFFAFNNYSMQEYTPATQGSAATYMNQQYAANPIKYAGYDPGRAFYLLTVNLSQFDRDKFYSTYKIRFAGLTVYNGDEAQLPNATMEAYIGVGKVPAYRGLAYFVIQGLQLEDFGNTIPAMTADVLMQDGKVKLYKIIEDLCDDAGLDPYNRSALGRIDERIDVSGYAIMQPHSARECIEDLMKVYPFDAWETGYAVKFGMVNKRPRFIVRRGDLGARLDKDEPPDSLNITRKHDYDMPAKVSFKYQEPARAFSTNTVYATRQTGEANTVDDIDVSIGMERTEAKTRVEEYLLNRYLHRREYKFTLPRRYVIIECGDVLLVPEVDETWQFLQLRVIQMDIGANGLVVLTCEDAFYHGPSVAITEDNIEDAGLEQLPPTGSRTYAYLLDVPPLREQDANQPGFYVVLAGSKGGWSGGALLVDINSGSTIPVGGSSPSAPSSGADWNVVADGRSSTVHGFCITTLRTDVSADGWDLASEIHLYAIDKSQEPANATMDDVVANPINVAVVGNEIIQYAEAIDLGQGNWKLRKFLRGRRGTENEIANHVDGERFVRIETANLQFVPHDATTLGKTFRFKTISVGVDITGDDESFDFVDTGNYLRPFAPDVILAQKVLPGGNFEVEWLPRARRGGGWNNEIETVIDQPFERYEIDIMNANAVLRTVTISDARTWTYTTAAQTSDWGGPISGIKLRLYQIGDIIGRGFVREFSAS